MGRVEAPDKTFGKYAVEIFVVCLAPAPASVPWAFLLGGRLLGLFGLGVPMTKRGVRA